jgi:microcystin-dependent protein
MDPFIGQISITAFDFAPRGWALCNGQAMAINQNQALFSILGTMYGGNGVTTFNLPDLRGRGAVAAGSQPPGGTGGAETVTLTTPQSPSHTHIPQASSKDGSQPGPAGAVWAKSTGGANQFVADSAPNAMMAAAASGPGGQGQAHPNMPPVLVVNFIIATQGIYPSRG